MRKGEKHNFQFRYQFSIYMYVHVRKSLGNVLIALFLWAERELLEVSYADPNETVNKTFFQFGL